MPKPQRTLLSQTKLARTLGVTTRSIRHWIELGLPQEGEGRSAKYPLEECIAWVRQKDREEAEAADDLDLKVERAGLIRAQRLMAEVELAEKRGQLLPVQQHMEAQSRIASRIRGKLLNIPGRYAPQLAGKHTAASAEQLLEDAVYEVLEELVAVIGTNGHRPTRPQPRRRGTRSRATR